MADRIYEFNGFDQGEGGILSLHKEGEDFLLMMEAEDREEAILIWIKKEELREFVDRMENGE